MNNNLVLDVNNLTKKFGGFTAVDNISLHIAEGEVLGLLGQNGAGKTTTIQTLLGVMDQTSGTIEYFGKSFSKHREEILKQINFSSTYISMPWLFKVEEILEIFGRLYEIPDRKKRINKLMIEFEIDHLRKNQFTTLSAGQQTRLFLAKAFLNYPRLILLDEPTASLDPDIAIRIRAFLKKEKSEYNTSMLFTSHNMSEVEEICDRVMIMKSGKVIDEDRPENLARKMRHTVVNLLIANDHVKAKRFFDIKNIPYEEDRKNFNIHVDEKNVADLLQTLTSENITYEEIAISKPSLEDYFLQVVKEDEK
jgi:ABC-2 type transport system ATP-binding protein